MGLLDDYKEMRDERQRKEAEMLANELKGCISEPIGCLGSLLNGFGGFLVNIIWKPPVILFIFLVSIFVLLPIKIIFYIVSFGHWNGFKNRFIDKISTVYYSKGAYD